MMNPLDASWSVLKGGFKTIDLIAQECDTMAECLESMQESFPDMDKETAIKLVTEARNNHARESMPQYDVGESRREGRKGRIHPSQKPEEDVSFPDFVEASPEEMRGSGNSNTKFADNEQQPYNPEQDPNPLDLSMDKLKGLGEEQ